MRTKVGPGLGDDWGRSGESGEGDECERTTETDAIGSGIPPGIGKG